MSNEMQTWEETNVDQVGKDYEDWSKGKTRVVKPPSGTSSWWVLPAMKGKGGNPFKSGVYVHFVKDPKNPGNIIAVGICPSKTRNEPCGVCPFLSMLRRTGVAADKELADDMAAAENIMCNAVQLSAQNPQVEILGLSMGVYKFLAQTLRDKVNGTDFTHPLTGRPVLIEKEGSLLNTKYTPRLAANPIPGGLPNKKWLEQMNDLDMVFEELDHEAIARTLTAAATPAQIASVGAQPAASQDVERLPAPALLPAKQEPEDLIEDPISGKMVPRSSLRR